MSDRRIFIAKNHNGKTLGIVIGDDSRIAYAFFAGRGQTPHTLETVDIAGVDLSAIGLITLFLTVERSVHNHRGLPETILVEGR